LTEPAFPLATEAPRPLPAILQALSRQFDGALVLLLARDGEDRAKVEEASPDPVAPGRLIRCPAGLLDGAPIEIVTADIRLPLDWVDMCGARPIRLLAAPVPGSDLHLALADTRADAIGGLDRVIAAAASVAETRQGGQATQRERDVSAKIAELIDNLPAPLIFVDSGSIEVFLNDRARALLGLPQDAPVQEATISAALRQFMPGHDMSAVIDLTSDQEAGQSLEIQHGDQHYKVETRWIEDGILQGRVWLFRDITVERALFAELSDLTALLQLTVDNVSEGVALVDKDLRLILWNDNFRELFDFPSKLLYRGGDYRALITLLIERGETAPAEDEHGLDGEQTFHERRTRLPRNDGRVLDVRRRSLAGGRSIITARDITDEQLAAKLKDELVSTVSHELRTPLTSIAGALALLAAGKLGELPPKVKQMIDIAHRNSDRLTRLVNDLLDMDKLRRGQVEFHFARTDLASLVREGAAQNASYAERFGVGIDVEAPDAPLVAVVDGDRILQVLGNFLSNASKFSSPDSVVTVRLTADTTTARIEVADRGRGMSPAFQKRLFTPFAQEHGPFERGQAGTGLGLAISRTIMDRHDGVISVTSTEGVGTSFTICLPLAGPKDRGLN
jgi:signal transduction histidine kinase